MKKLINEIHKGKNIKKNLVLYRDRAVQTYCEYGVLDLTFGAYTFIEQIVEEQAERAQKEKDVIAPVLLALGELAKEDCAYGQVAGAMKKLRQEITDKMDLFTSYADSLICYEYVLNRMELKFLPEEKLADIFHEFEEEQFLRQVREFLTESKDQSVMQDRVRRLVGQLPVHMTKYKLFEQIGEALTLYQGSDCASLDEFVYMLRTSAMLYKPEKYAGEYAAVQSDIKRLQEADYAGLSEEEYKEMMEVLERAAEAVYGLTDFYYSLQKVVNGIYAMSLLFPYMETESKLVKDGRAIWKCLAMRECHPEMLIPLEGRIEQCIETYDCLEPVLYEVKDSYKEELHELSLTEFIDDMTKIVSLLSDSLFVDLECAGGEKVADADYVRQCSEQLREELSQQFLQLSRPLKRAVTSQLLEKMPLMFSNMQELEEYIRVNLFGCQDRAEKAVVMLLLQELMQEEKRWS